MYLFWRNRIYTKKSVVIWHIPCTHHIKWNSGDKLFSTSIYFSDMTKISDTYMQRVAKTVQIFASLKVSCGAKLVWWKKHSLSGLIMGNMQLLSKELLLIYQNRFVALYLFLLSQKLFHFLAPSSLQGFSTGRSLTQVYQGHSQTLKILERSLSKWAHELIDEG